MKRWALIALMALGCAAGEAPPTDLLDRTTFKRVLMEAQLIEARASHEVMTAENNAARAAEQYSELFRTEKITDARFRKTFDWYTQHPDQLKALYEEILVDLQHAADSTAHARPHEEGSK